MTIAPCAQEVTFQLGGLALAGQQWGDPNAPLILALHGWLDNSESFAPLAPLLVAQGYQVLALDWAGHGLSNHRCADQPYILLDNLFDLHGVIAQLPVKPFCLLGHSMGGILAQLYAGIYPEQVRALVSIEALGPLTDQAGKSAERLRQGFASRVKRRSPVQGYSELGALIEARARAGRFDRTIAARLLDRNLVKRDDRWFWRSDPKLRQKSAWMMTGEQAQDYLAGFNRRSLLILGDDGLAQLKQMIPLRQQWFSDLQIETVAGGHHCHMQSAEQIVPLLQLYFASMTCAC